MSRFPLSRPRSAARNCISATTWKVRLSPGPSTPLTHVRSCELTRPRDRQHVHSCGAFRSALCKSSKSNFRSLHVCRGLKTFCGMLFPPFEPEEIITTLTVGENWASENAETCSSSRSKKTRACLDRKKKKREYSSEKTTEIDGK